MNKKEEVKSTVISMRDDYDWGKIFFDACYIFNKKFAEYCKDYADKFDNGLIVMDNSDEKKNELLNERNDIIQKRANLHDEVKMNSSNAISCYRAYSKTLPIGKYVSKWRNHCLLNNNKSDDFVDKYFGMIKQRKELKQQYKQYKLQEAVSKINEREYLQSNLFLTRKLNYQIKYYNKMNAVHSKSLYRPMKEDIDIIYDLLMSEEQAEKLMGLCINILNTYSEKEFSTAFEINNRERVAEMVYEIFMSFMHNYDVLTGCYEIKEDNKLHIKNAEVLKNKIYNGYYFTLKGFLKQAYISARKEKNTVLSVDMNWEEDDDNGNHGVDNYSEFQENYYTMIGTASSGFGEGMIDFWCSCKDYLIENKDEMSAIISKEMSVQFPKMIFYNSDKTKENISVILLKIIDSINDELSNGNDVGNRMKHIILDAMGGAENKNEWNCFSEITLKVLMKYINLFFNKDKKEFYEENMFFKIME